MAEQTTTIRMMGQATVYNVPAASSGQEHAIKTSQDEILMYPGENDEVIFSPEVLSIYVEKRIGQDFKIQSLTTDNLKIYYQQPKANSTDNEFVEIYYLENNITENILSFKISEAALPNKLEETVLKINYLIGEDSYLERFITVRAALNQDMAKLALKAGGIYASVQDSKLDFTADGLKIQNGAFRIVEEDYEPVKLTEEEYNKGEYYILVGGAFQKASGAFDDEQNYYKFVETQLLGSENGNLALRGNIYANDGYFNGEINASSGSISGYMEIGENSQKIILGAKEESDEKGIYSSNYIKGESGFYLDLSGTIYTNNLEIGGAAYVKSTLNVGDSCFINGNKNEIIEIKNDEKNLLVLKNNGELTLNPGDENRGILLSPNGTESQGAYIESLNYEGGLKGWHIDNETAEFNNIIARGTLNAAVFSATEVQAVGGAMLVRPSAKIKSCESINENEFRVVLESPTPSFYPGALCSIRDKIIKYQVSKDANYQNREGENIQELVLQFLANEYKEDLSSFVGQTIIDFALEDGDTLKDNIGIAINSTDSNAAYANHAISVFEIIKNDTGYDVDSKIVLGEMKGNYGGLQGYGLYADNVYLEGCLMAHSKTDKNNYYSGLHTKNTVEWNTELDAYNFFYPETDGIRNNAPLLFWAGAKDSSDKAIQESKFIVDVNGNMYAGSGYFEGAIISRSTIEAAEIKTAVITGTGNPENSADAIGLQIKDIANAISFTGTKDGTEKQFLKLTNTELTVDVQGIFNENIQAESFETKAKSIKLIDDKIQFKNNAAQIESQINMSSDIKGKYLSISVENIDNPIVKIRNGEAEITSNCRIDNELSLGVNMTYKPFSVEGEIKGYDLYITQEEKA